MSSLAISNSASTTLPVVNFHGHGHGHKKGMLADSLTSSSSSTSNGTSGQLPVGAAQGLFGNLLQTLEQIIGVQPAATTAPTAATGVGGVTGTGTAVSAVSGASATAANPALAQDLSGFLHSLFQVLKQESAGAGTGAAASSAGAPAAAGAGQYQGSLASSLQALIQQVGSTGPASPAIANLDSSFNTLVNGLNGNAASASAGTSISTQSSNTALQGFLNNLLQNLQANGLQAPKLAGTNVNANV
jgi:hypothetical protein